MFKTNHKMMNKEITDISLNKNLKFSSYLILWRGTLTSLYTARPLRESCFRSRTSGAQRYPCNFLSRGECLNSRSGCCLQIWMQSCYRIWSDESAGYLGSVLWLLLCHKAYNKSKIKKRSLVLTKLLVVFFFWRKYCFQGKRLNLN